MPPNLQMTNWATFSDDICLCGGNTSRYASYDHRRDKKSPEHAAQFSNSKIERHFRMIFCLCGGHTSHYVTYYHSRDKISPEHAAQFLEYKIERHFRAIFVSAMVIRGARINTMPDKISPEHAAQFINYKNWVPVQWLKFLE